MNDEEAREIIDNMSEQELNDFIFFSLQEVEKENQKLKTELENKDKEIQFQKEINKTEQDRHKQTEKSLKGQLKKKDKIINEMAKELSDMQFCTNRKDCNIYKATRSDCKECIKQYFEYKVEEDK